MAGMGTKVQCKSYLPGYYSMRDLNDDSNSFGWPLFYGDKPLTNGQYYNGFLPRVAADAYPGYDKDAVKRTMLEHEAIFKNQVNLLSLFLSSLSFSGNQFICIFEVHVTCYSAFLSV